MNALLDWLIATGSLIFYGGVGTAIGTTYYRRMEATCRDGYCEHGFAAAMGSIFWPLGVWLLIGFSIATKPQRQKVERERRVVRLRQLERDMAIRCTHGNYTADCLRCRGYR